MTAPAYLHSAGAAFDRLAGDYDEHFTNSLIGRAQRHAVWRKLATIFTSGQHILELNCGTGEDLIFMTKRGIAVTALDASEQMILRARFRCAHEVPDAAIQIACRPSEQLAGWQPETQFDGIFSNFSGLNCVSDLEAVARQLALRIPTGSPLLLCFSTRYCLWEMIWYFFRGDLHKAFRRCGGEARAAVGGIEVAVHYPTLRALLRIFAPQFVLRSCTGIGVTVPPSYLEPWARKHPKTIAWLAGLDRLLCRLPLVRVFGDHMLLHFEKVCA
jgi:SAM-dependent methyltransferase